MARRVRFLAALLLSGAAWLTTGCEPPPDAESRALDYVRVPLPLAQGPRSHRQGLEVEGEPLFLFLNFCEGGCRFTPGADDARIGTSSIPSEPVTLPESVMSDEEHDELLRCLYQIFEPFEVLITRERPMGRRYVEAVIAGEARDLGLSPTIAGISPLACGLIEYGVNFNFFKQIPRVDGIQELCNVIAHETGHTIGLEHAYLCSDVMTYLPHCEDPAYFTRADVQCGGFFPETCTCGPDFQNSHLTVMEELGPRRTPIQLPPRLRILSPEPLVGVEQGFFVVVDATDEHGVREVEIFLDGLSQGVLREPPFAFATALDWPLGPVSVRAVATNSLGLTSTATRELEVRKRLPEWDAGFLDAAGPRPDAGMSWSPADAGASLDASVLMPFAEEGCVCVRSRPASAGTFSGLIWMALALFLGSWARRRSALVLLVAASVLGAVACESDRVQGVRPEFASEPAQGDLLDFGELILGERLPRPLDLQIRNEGESSLSLGEAALDPSPVGELRLIGPFQSRVEPAGSTELILSFHPERPGLLESELVLPTNDPDHPTARFPVRARVRERCRLLPWPTALDFRLGDEREVSLLSASSAPCQVTAFGLDERIFEIVNAPALPVEIEPGEELRLVVRHHTRTQEPHVPVRTLRVHEAETTGADVRLIGAYPIWKCLVAYPEEHEFPETAAGASSELLLTVTNRCLEPAEIDSLSMPYGAEAFSSRETEFPIIVPPHGRAAAKVAFEPPDGVDYYGRVRINTNDAGNLGLYVGMLGRAFGPVFGAPPRLDLGAVPFPSPSGTPCGTPVRTLPIFNLGAGGLLVHGLELSGADASSFSVEGVDVDGAAISGWESGFAIPPYQRAAVRLRFEPSRASPSDHQAVLLVRHTPGEIVHEIELSARSFGEAESVQRFSVTRPEVDVLFVVDGSRSMQTRHQALASQISSFVDRADAELPSYQLSLISGRQERPEGGRLLGCRFRDSVIRSEVGSPAERAADFRCALGTNRLDERPQAGLAAAALALGRAAFPARWDPTSFDNERFLRQEAHLALLFLSDEDDLSSPDVELLHELYRAAKGGRGDLLRVHSWVVPPGGRCPGRRYSVPGDRYVRAAELAQGSVEDICAEDLGPALSRITEEVTAPVRGFPLSHWAHPSSVAVYVNGVPALLDADFGYTIDRETNTVVFAPSAAPAEGSDIEVRYRSLCAG